MKSLTITGIPPDLEAALRLEADRRNLPMNQLILDLLRQGLGLEDRLSNGLARLGGSWSDEDLREFEQATEVFSRIDEEIWR